MNVSEVKAFKCGRCQRLYLSDFPARECCKCETCGSQSSRPGHHKKCDPCQWTHDMASARSMLDAVEAEARGSVARVKREIARLERSRPEELG